jgi:sulfate transport system substrate-binding protein
MCEKRVPVCTVQRIAWKFVLILFVLALVASVATSCGSSSTRARSQTLTVYGFSILGEAFTNGIFPAFAQKWGRETGQRVEFFGAFAGSGTVTNQILFGAPAEVAILSHELDALRLQDARVVRTDWRTFLHHGVINRTPFIIVTRPGNPLHVHDFGDLARPGLRLAHPDPLTSGGALWAILAEYGSISTQGGSAAEAERQLLGIWRNVRYQASSARAVRTQFEAGFGDALVTYEQETLSKRIRGTVIYPPATILSEHVAVLVDRNIGEDKRELATRFLQFLWSGEGQAIFVKYGFRSVDDALNQGEQRFANIAHPFTVASLRGWSRAKATIIDAAWKQRVLPEVQR